MNENSNTMTNKQLPFFSPLKFRKEEGVQQYRFTSSWLFYKSSSSVAVNTIFEIWQFLPSRMFL